MPIGIQYTVRSMKKSNNSTPLAISRSFFLYKFNKIFVRYYLREHSVLNKYFSTHNVISMWTCYAVKAYAVLKRTTSLRTYFSEVFFIGARFNGFLWAYDAIYFFKIYEFHECCSYKLNGPDHCVCVCVCVLTRYCQVLLCLISTHVYQCQQEYTYRKCNLCARVTWSLGRYDIKTMVPEWWRGNLNIVVFR